MSKYSNVPISDFCIEIVDCLNRTAPVVEKTTPFKMIRTSNVRDGFVDLSECRHVTKEIYEKWTRRRKPAIGDIVLTREAPLGNVGIIREENTFLGQRTVQYVIDEKIADKFFLMYYLMSYQGQAQIKALGSGSTVHHMRVPDSKKIMIPKVPLEIQKKVGFILSQYDELIINNTKKIKILEEIAQRLYEEWFVHFKFAGHEKAKMIDSELGKIPEGWKLLPFPELVAIQRGKSYRSIDLSDDEGLEFINLKCIERNGGFRRDGLKKYTGDYKDGHIVNDGDIVMAVTDMTQARDLVGRVALIPKLKTDGVISMDLVKIIPKNIDSIYLYSHLRYSSIPHRLKNMANGANVLHLRPDKIESQNILLPPNEIIDTYSSIASKLIKLKNNLEEKNEILSQTRDLLLPKLIAGEIEV